MAHGDQVGRQKIEKLKPTPEQPKKSQANKVRERNKWWLIETTNDEESGEYGVDYLDNRVGHIAPSMRSKLVPLVFVFHFLH